MSDNNGNDSVAVKGTALLNPGTKDESWGLLKDFTKTSECDKEEVMNGKGDVVSLIYTKVRQKVSATYTPLASGGGPVSQDAETLIGSTLQLSLDGNSNITIYVENAELSGTQGGAPSFKIEGYYYPEVQSNGGGSGD